MSIDDDLVGSEFELSEEEKAQLALEEGTEGQDNDQIEEVDQATLDVLLNGTTADDVANDDPEKNQDELTTQNHRDDSENHESLIIREQVDLFETSLNDLQIKIDEYDQKEQSTLTEIDELGKLLDEGEIGQGEYTSRLKRLELQLESLKNASQVAHQQYQHTDQEYKHFAQDQQDKHSQQWQSELTHFLEKNPAYIEDGAYKTRFDEVFYDLRDKEVFTGLSFAQVIATVQHRVEIELGQPENVKNMASPKALPKRDHVTIPPSMNQLQALEDNAGGDEFAMIDRLQGIEYEQAIEKLEKNNPEAYKRYMN